VGGIGWIAEQSKPVQARNNLPRYINPFAHYRELEVREAREVSSWMSEAVDEPLAHRVSYQRKHNWNSSAVLLNCSDPGRPGACGESLWRSSTS
jgi:hypothetical protein